MTMLGSALQLQPRGSCSAFDDKCLSPHCSPDVVPSNFHLFPRMKLCLRGQRFGADNELQTNVENWLKAQAAGLYDEGIGMVVPRYENVYVGTATM